MNKLNWPTAFVITAIIFAGAFIYNKPTTAAFGSDGTIVATGNWVWPFCFLKETKLRFYLPLRTNRLIKLTFICGADHRSVQIFYLPNDGQRLNLRQNLRALRIIDAKLGHFIKTEMNFGPV